MLWHCCIAFTSMSELYPDGTPLLLTELIKVHGTPDAPGVSPADIYGLDNKKLRECIQGLALTLPGIHPRLLYQ